MKVLLYQDDTLTLNLDAIASEVGSASGLKVAKGRAQFLVKGNSVNYPKSYEQLPPKLIGETKGAGLTICFTKIPYDNNYFFQGEEDLE